MLEKMPLGTLPMYLRGKRIGSTLTLKGRISRVYSRLKKYGKKWQIETLETLTPLLRNPQGQINTFEAWVADKLTQKP